jgi:hypothetical protein
MVFEYEGERFLTDNDLQVNILGFWPIWNIQNYQLKRIFQEVYNRDFLGGDELVSYYQPLVAGDMDFGLLENEILKDIITKEESFEETIFKKTATGIGRGHSLGGLSGVVLGVHGTKMIDSGLTGFVASRSLVTSSRRRETKTEEIVVPESLSKRQDLLEEYLEISRDVFQLSKEFKEKIGKLGGVETFNKVIPYNNPADLYIVLPLDTLATLEFEARQDKLNPNGNFLPRELIRLAEEFQDVTRKTGMNIMYNQRIEVPRDTYLHYCVFKDPSLPNYALEQAEKHGMPLEPLVLDYSKDLTPGFRKELEKLKELFEKTKQVDAPKELVEKSQECMLAMKNFVNEGNEIARVKVLDTLSWRVWSEQKRHATLRQNVESVYSGADRAYQEIKELWPVIKEIHDTKNGKIPYDRLEKIIVIDDRLKEKPELAIPYVYHTARQLMFYGKMLEEGFEPRDALYIVPKNIRLKTLENYDVINAIDLEHPLRLCSTCEPERYASSWKKREAIAKVLPEFSYFLQPKCNVGFCTEKTHCKHITEQRSYDKELHKAAKKAMLDKARS